MSESRKTRILVLGGGMGSLAALFALTSTPNWDRRFSITVLQQGWRLGGKCASGRNQENRQRNEEHGLHVLGGFYHNTFKMLRNCYKDWRHIEFEQAFEEQDTFVLSQKIGGNWQHMPIPMQSPGTPGVTPPPNLTPLAIVKRLFGLVREIEGELNEYGDAAARFKQQFAATARKIEDLVLADIGPSEIDQLDSEISSLQEIVKGISPAQQTPWKILVLVIIELGLLISRAIFVDRVIFKGFDVINDDDALAYVKKYGASDRLLESTFVNSGYEYAFAYIDGDLSKKNFAAGVAIRALLRLLLTHYGSVFWHMRGGMGEIVIAPLYEVLAKRGVKFRFFHQVSRLRLNADGTNIEAVEYLRQAEPKDGVEGYNPLVMWSGRKGWPLNPKYELLKDGDDLARRGTDLESFWADSSRMPNLSLCKDVDFDIVVLGIPVGALRTICSDLIDRHARWDSLIKSQKTTPTMGAQFWLLKPLKELGWRTSEQPLLTGYERPLSTWADMSFLLKIEGDRTSLPYQNLSYVCGPFRRADNIPSPPAPTFPREEAERAAFTFRTWLKHALRDLLTSAGNQANDDFARDLKPETFIRPNINPSDEYVLSTAGSISDRLATDDTGIHNLYLTGDWIKTGIDAGAVEAAVTAGLQCSRAISGRPQYIYGETDFH